MITSWQSIRLRKSDLQILKIYEKSDFGDAMYRAI
jgi:hypothetical protein